MRDGRRGNDGGASTESKSKEEKERTGWKSDRDGMGEGEVKGERQPMNDAVCADRIQFRPRANSNGRTASEVFVSRQK